VDKDRDGLRSDVFDGFEWVATRILSCLLLLRDGRWPKVLRKNEWNFDSVVGIGAQRGESIDNDWMMKQKTLY
jgi:hypothetical protein